MIDIIEKMVFEQMFQAGRQEGMAAVLQKLLEKRFGPLPEWAQAKLATANEEALEAWTLRLDEISSIENLLS